MKRIQAYKFRIEPNGKQIRDMRKIAGSCRFVYNKALALQIANREAGLKHASHFDMNKWITLWKKEEALAWLKEAPAQVLQQSLKDLGTAYSNFFAKRASFPEFKKKGRSTDSFRFPQQFKVDDVNNRIKLPKLGWIRYRGGRKILGKVKSITVSCVANKWYASILTEREVESPIHPSKEIVGIDLGITRFATLSDGSFIEPFNAFKKNQKRLVTLQRRLAKKKKFSENWKKAKAQITKLHTKIRNTRLDFLHKTSTTICKNHAIVIIEDLKVSNMSKSAKGSLEKPGKNVKAKSGLNRAILDQGWGEFRRQLEYKQAWLGGQVLAINPRNTSRTCPECKYVAKENRKSQSKFLCVSCGYTENADLVGAMNIKAAGLAVLACGEKTLLGHSVKQEPAEVILK